MDMVEAHVLGLDWLAAGKGSRVFHLGTGTGFSVREVIAVAEAATGRKVPHRIGPRRAGDATRLVSGSRRAAQELGWTPRHSTLEAIDRRCLGLAPDGRVPALSRRLRVRL